MKRGQVCLCTRWSRPPGGNCRERLDEFAPQHIHSLKASVSEGHDRPTCRRSFEAAGSRSVSTGAVCDARNALRAGNCTVVSSLPIMKSGTKRRFVQYRVSLQGSASALLQKLSCCSDNIAGRFKILCGYFPSGREANLRQTTADPQSSGYAEDLHP
jgi:hypothetical protein